MRKFTPEEKWAIVQEGRQGPRNVSRVCKKHGISRETFYTWEEQIKQAALAALTNETPGRKPANQPTTMSEARALLNEHGEREAELAQRIQHLENRKRLLELQHEWVQFRINQMPEAELRAMFDQISKKKRYTVEEKRWLLTQAPAKHDPLPIADYLGMLGVSEASFHRWQAHPDELKNASSRPKQSPQALPVDEVAQVLVAALKHPDWGGEKISDYLAINGITYVSPATASRIKKRLKAALGGRMPKFSQRYEFIKPNDAWATDIFQFTWESHKLYLIIVQDDHSRLILNWTITANTSSAIVQQLLIQTFGRYGLPVLLKTDNGPEFRKQLREFLESYRSHHYPSPPYRPSFNGKVERKYRDMRELIKDIPTDATLETVIGCIAEHIYEHNHVRPHQSLGGTTPFQRYHGFAEQVKAQVEQIKAEVDRRRREPATKLIIPGQPERPTRPQALIVPNKKKDGDSKGLIVPLRSADNRRKRVGFVRLFIAS